MERGNTSTAQHMTTRSVGEAGARGTPLYCWQKSLKKGNPAVCNLPRSAVFSLLEIYTKDTLAKIRKDIYATLSRNEVLLRSQLPDVLSENKRRGEEMHALHVAI